MDGNLATLALEPAVIGVSAFTTIQAAINAVATGGTVHVNTGTYSEYVIINKDITVHGQDRNSTVLESGGVGVAITASGATFEGFTVQHATTYGIYPQADSVTIQDNIVQYNSTGIYGNLGGPNMIGLRILNNTIRNNATATGGNGGVYLTGSAALDDYQSLEISGNVASDNYANALTVEGSTGAIFRNNQVSGTLKPTSGGWSEARAIGLTFSTGGLVENNQVSSGSNYAILVGNTGNSTIGTNTVSGYSAAGGVGIWVSAGGSGLPYAGNVVTENILTDCTFGIGIQKTGSVSVTNNVITGSTTVGIRVASNGGGWPPFRATISLAARTTPWICGSTAMPARLPWAPDRSSPARRILSGTIRPKTSIYWVQHRPSIRRTTSASKIACTTSWTMRRRA